MNRVSDPGDVPGPSSVCQGEDGVVLVLTTFPDAALAEQAAREWVESGLAACVHIAAAGRSVYRWQGAVECADEVAVTLKTTAARLESLMGAVRAGHPYELPEWLVVPVSGERDYIGWIRGACKTPPG